jgi:AsmA protein
LPALCGRRWRHSEKNDNKEPPGDERYTDFAALSANFLATNGTLTTQDLRLFSPFIRLLGDGQINLANETMDIRTKVLTTSSSVGQGATNEEINRRGIPIKITGQLADPSINIDGQALKEQWINAEKENIQAQLKEKEAALKAEAQKKLSEEEKTKLQDKAKAEKQKVLDEAAKKAKDSIGNQLKNLFGK